MWIYITLILFFAYALYKEREALGCSNIPPDFSCNNENGKAVKGTQPSLTDTNHELLSKIKFAANYESRYVQWRRFYIISIITSIVIWWLLFQVIPPETNLLLMMIVLMFAMMGASSFYRFHLTGYVTKNIDNASDILSSRL